MSLTPFEESYGRSRDVVRSLRCFYGNNAYGNNEWNLRAVVETRSGLPAWVSTCPQVVWYGTVFKQYCVGGWLRRLHWVNRAGETPDAATAELLEKAAVEFQEERNRAESLPATHPDRLVLIARLSRDLWGDT